MQFLRNINILSTYFIPYAEWNAGPSAGKEVVGRESVVRSGIAL